MLLSSSLVRFGFVFLIDIIEFVNAFHYGEEVRFRRLDVIIGGTGSSGLAGWLLNDPELLLVSAEEPPMFMLAERDANW